MLRTPITYLLAAALLTLSGCAFMQTSTSRQLEPAENVFSAVGTWPGSAAYPRGSLQYMRGLERGDVSAHIGTSTIQVGGGLAGRYYINSKYQFEAAVLYQYGLRGIDIPRHAVQPRIGISSSTTRERKFYWGTDFHSYFGTGYPVVATLIHTISGGFEVPAGDDATVYMEMSLPLWGIYPDSEFAIIGMGTGAFNPLYWNGFQIGLGVNFFNL